MQNLLDASEKQQKKKTRVEFAAAKLLLVEEWKKRPRSELRKPSPIYLMLHSDETYVRLKGGKITGKQQPCSKTNSTSSRRLVDYCEPLLLIWLQFWKAPNVDRYSPSMQILIVLTVIIVGE